jgi:hypothetical protein
LCVEYKLQVRSIYCERQKTNLFKMPGDQSMKPCLKKKKVVTFNVRIGNCDDIKEVFYVDKEYHEVFVNDEEFSSDARKKKQLMVVDIGCPRSLLGFEEYERFKDSLSSCELRKVKEFEANEKFRFGLKAQDRNAFKCERFEDCCKIVCG